MTSSKFLNLLDLTYKINIDKIISKLEKNSHKHLEYIFKKSFLEKDFVVSWGDIFTVQTRRVPLTIVFRYREIGGRLCTKWRKKVLFLL
jgi:hypothetical protein